MAFLFLSRRATAEKTGTADFGFSLARNPGIADAALALTGSLLLLLAVCRVPPPAQTAFFDEAYRGTAMSMSLLVLLWVVLSCVAAPWIGRFCAGACPPEEIAPEQVGFHVDPVAPVGRH